MKTSMYTFFEKTIIDSIDLTDYNFESDALLTNIKEVYNIFKSEYGHEITRQGSEVKAFKEWLQGLPSVLSVPFMNYDILERAETYGTFKLTSTEQEDKYLKTYWMKLAEAFFTLKNNL